MSKRTFFLFCQFGLLISLANAAPNSDSPTEAQLETEINQAITRYHQALKNGASDRRKLYQEIVGPSAAALKGFQETRRSSVMASDGASGTTPVTGHSDKPAGENPRGEEYTLDGSQIPKEIVFEGRKPLPSPSPSGSPSR